MLTPADFEQLRTARQLLENPGLAARLTNLIGSPIEKGLDLLPGAINKSLTSVTHNALMKAADTAIFTLQDSPGLVASNSWHKVSVALSGGVGGFFGMPGLALELPISTLIILRSIADIARSEGEPVSTMESKLACLEVFALGGRSSRDDGSESGYFAVRALLAKSITDASQFIAAKGMSKEATPLVMKLVEKIAARFGVQVTEKFAAQSLPIVGAAGGAIINSLFIAHFQDMARGHFIVRKLERIYGSDVIKLAYENIDAAVVDIQ